jgi:hypothetical protein
MDLKNSLAAVTDARRQLEVVANALQGVVNVRAEGDIATPLGDNPVDFRGVESSFRAGLAFVAPLDQIDERNSYRTAVINYQRARRAYMAFEDQVKGQVRASWRQLDLLRRNFETARQAVRITALQFDSAVEQASNPVQQQGGRTAINLLNALSDVLDAQNALVGNAVNYEQQRLNIYRDMDIMEVDPRGLWVDDIYQELAADQQENTRSGGGNVPPEPDVPPGIDPEVTDAAEGTLEHESVAAGSGDILGNVNGSSSVDGEWRTTAEAAEAGEAQPQPAGVDRAALVAPAGGTVGDGGGDAADADESFWFDPTGLFGIHH